MRATTSSLEKMTADFPLNVDGDFKVIVFEEDGPPNTDGKYLTQGMLIWWFWLNLKREIFH